MAIHYEKGTHEYKLCIYDAIASLGLIAARKGAPIHIKELQISFASCLWLVEQNFFTSRMLGRDSFQFFLTVKGIAFMREHGQHVDATIVAIRASTESTHEGHELEHVYVQHTHGGKIIPFWDLVSLPRIVQDALHMGLLAVHNGKLFGLSEAHILGED